MRAVTAARTHEFRIQSKLSLSFLPSSGCCLRQRRVVRPLPAGAAAVTGLSLQWLAAAAG